MDSGLCTTPLIFDVVHRLVFIEGKLEITQPADSDLLESARYG